MKNFIKIKGAREHNLKNIDVDIPRDKMVVITGVSGSGKSSLAFDTVFAEGQRRYIESLSAYARQFLEKTGKPDVDEITGLSPAISIDQKSHSRNPRSTVATITEIYDYMRVLYARAGEPFCPICGKKIRKMTVQEIVDAVIEFSKIKEGKGITVLSTVVRGRKGEYYQMLYNLLDAGFYEARIDGEFKSLRDRIDLDRYKQHTIDVVVDRLPYGMDLNDKDNRLRLSEAVEIALRRGDGFVTFLLGDDEFHLSSKFACPDDNFSFPEIEPRLFSFNSPYGACETCHGIGLNSDTENFANRKEKICESCEGKRLRPEALSILLSGKNIASVAAMTIGKAKDFFVSLQAKAGEKELEIMATALREIEKRLKFLVDVGLDYLTLDRKAGTLSGGEGQRIRLASQIGSGLTGTLYVLDEPTIGLHQHDNARLIKTLHDLRDLGNSVLVVEHDEQMMMESDYLIDIGPGPGVHGGELIVAGKMPDLISDGKESLQSGTSGGKNKKEESITLEYLRGNKKIEIPETRRKVVVSSRTVKDKKIQQDSIKIRKATQNNLKSVNVDIPLRRFSAVTGVSGSGKSTLVIDVLYKHLANKLHGAKYKSGRVEHILGAEYINRVINIDQSPIGRTPRSNPATYSGAWNHIRDLFASTEDARIRGYRKGRFSFNTKGGRCENCEGHGTIAIEMHFLPTVYIVCDVCGGKRYDRETLEVEYRGKNIHEVLQMTIEEGRKFFNDIPWLDDRFKVLEEVGLGYLRLGQPSPTLSGGEAQRVKLASELGKRDTRRTLYILDEPTTGLHFADVAKLIEVLQKLVDRGNTVLVIEHNLDVIKCADWIIDLGPDGGENGGKLVAEGSPEELARKKTYTGEYLRKVMK